MFIYLRYRLKKERKNNKIVERSTRNSILKFLFRFERKQQIMFCMCLKINKK
jgi:hypothetical protein